MMDSPLFNRARPKLERRNALKNVDYEASGSSSYSAPQSPAHLESRLAIDLDSSYPFGGSLNSFRVHGEDGIEKIQRICKSLGLSGPDDLAITTEEFRARKIKTQQLPLQNQQRKNEDTSPNFYSFSRLKPTENKENSKFSSVLHPESHSTDRAGENICFENVTTSENTSPSSYGRSRSEGDRCIGVSVRIREELSKKTSYVSAEGVSVINLAPPPSLAPKVRVDHGASSWDLVMAFAPEEEEEVDDRVSANLRDHSDSDSSSDEEEEKEQADDEGAEGNEKETELEGTRSSISSGSNEGESSSSTTEDSVNYVSPEARLKVRFNSWSRGHMLGRGSFGTVYEGISDDGFFFAVKEVSLVDQDSNAKQSIYQLEQEIALLSQFEHENIVRYFGTDKEPNKLYIFLELVTQGSLASLYQKYNLRDSQVCAYTRQILTGLKYLHDRKVMHRDIKCANILVDAHGLIKLADFGLAKETSKLNELKSCKGSAYWMAPEVVNPRKTYWLPADIWSLGCTVIEMLTRTHPYGGLEWHRALWKVGHGEAPPFPDSLSKEAKDFVQQCLQVEPEYRPTADELLNHPFVKRSFSVDLHTAPTPAESR